MTPNAFAKANRNLQRAIVRGDIDTAVQWTLVLCKQIQIARSLVDLADKTPRPKRRHEKLKPEARPAAPPAPDMPVMLDPDGFSPGGTPNWYRNLQRLNNAGLPASLAPPTRRERQRAAAAQSSQAAALPAHPTKT